MLKKIFVLFFVLSLSPITSADVAKTFSEAKSNARKIYSDHRRSFYCNCKFDKNLRTILQSCNYKIRKNPTRAARIEWEHIVPASLFGRNMPSKCWAGITCKNSKIRGRQCCLDSDRNFRKMHNDLHNLVPAVGEINLDRYDYTFGEKQHPTNDYGLCKIKINAKRKIVEPPDEVKGFIARTYLYFNYRYSLKLKASEKNLFLAWHQKFPPDEWEIERNIRIGKIQGNYNPFIPLENSFWQKLKRWFMLAKKGL